MSTKKKLLSGIMALVMCFSLIVGSTLALFTSESTTNIAVTSGTVNVQASLTLDSLFSPDKIELDGVGSTVNAASTENKTFANGGTVIVDGASIQLVNMTPGDKAIFKVTITNRTNVAFMQRLTFGMTQGDAEFFSQLLVGISDDGEHYTYYSDFATAWENGTPIENDTPAVSYKYVSIEMPTFVENKWQNKTCTLTLNLSAVQGNVDATDEAVEEVVTVVTAAEVAEAINTAADGAVIFLSEYAESVSVAFDDAKEVVIRGNKIGTLHVNAPNGTLHVYNNVGIIYGEHVAYHSLYVYGDVDNIVMNDGRVVVESTAYVKEVEISPAAGESVKLAIPTTVVNDAEISGIVEHVVVHELASDAKVDIIAPEATVIEGEGKDEATTVVGGSELSYVEDAETKILSIHDAAGLRALATKVNSGTSFAGWTVVLTNDIDLEYEPWTPIGKRNAPFQANFDGQGHTISNLYINKEIGNIAASNRQGLFGTIVPSGATYFKNMTLHNADVTAGYHVGAVIATSDSSSQTATGNYLVVTNIKLTGDVKIEGWQGVGGVMGSGNMAEMSAITVDVEPGSYVSNTKGGPEWYFNIIGSVKGGGYLSKIDDIKSNMDVNGISCGIGGLFGVIGGQSSVICEISNASYSGTVTVKASIDTHGSLYQYSYNGLIVGSPRFNVKADQDTCTSTGTLILNTEEGTKTSNDMDDLFTWGVDLFGASRDTTYTNKSYSKTYASN